MQQYTLAFVGSCGSGKTSLVRRMLLGRHVEPQSPELVLDDPKLNHIPMKAKKRLVQQTTVDFDPFYRVMNSNYWNDNLIFNLFDMMPMKGGKARTGILKGLSFSDGAVLLLDISKFTTAVSNRDQVADEIIGKSLLTIFSSSSVLKDLIVIVNKMDTVDYSVELFDYVRLYIEKTFQQMHGSFVRRNTSLRIIPMSIKCGEGIDHPIGNNRGFKNQYDSFVTCLRNLKSYEYDSQAPFRMIQFKTYSMYGLGRITTGKILSGTTTNTDEFEICQCTLKTTFTCTSGGHELQSFDQHISQSMAGDLLACNLYRGWALDHYDNYYGPMTYFNKSQTTCRPCISYFTLKLSGPICRMRLIHRSDELLLFFFGFQSRVKLISKSDLLSDSDKVCCIYATFQFHQDKNNPAFTLETFDNVPEMSRVTVALDGNIIGYGIVSFIGNDKNYSICYSFLHPARVLQNNFSFQDVTLKN